MKNLNVIAQDLFNKIRGRFPSVTIGNEKGEVTNVPKESRFYDFDYKEGDTSLGKISISLDENAISVMYSDNIVANEDSFTKNKWYDFLKELRVFAKKRMLNFDTRNITKSNLNRRDYKFLSANRSGEVDMNESKLYGTSKTSYQNIDSARLAIRHNKPVNMDLPSGRTQHIDSIYIESAEGERFKYPYKHLNGARAMARHVAEGGKPFDEFGTHITGLSEELSKLRKFKNYMNRSSVMAESLSEYVDVVKERIDTVKNTVTKLQKSSYYQEAVQNFEQPVFEEVPDDVKENWIDELTIKQFNEELADVFPYIYKLVSEATRAKELSPSDLLGEGREVDEDYVRDLLKQFDHEAKDHGMYGEVNPETVIRHLEQGDVQAAVDEVHHRYAGPDGEEGDRGFDNLIDDLEDDFRYVVDNEDDGQPSSYDEYQDLHGGDDYDFGQYDEGVWEENIESIFDEMMGQFSEGDKMARVPLDGPVTTYTVQKGDTLFSLAKKIGTSVDMLKKLNRMDGDNIKIGQKLNIPESTNEEYGPEDDDFHKGIHVKLGGDPDSWKPHRDRPTDGDHVELKVPKRYRGVSEKLKKIFSKLTNIDVSKLDIDYTKGQRTVMIDGENPHPSILSALNGTLDKFDTGEHSGLYKEGNKFSGELEKARKQGKDEFELDGEKIPVTEFVLSFFDRETGQFPRGETAVLTKVEKDYGEQFIEPAKQFIEAINNKVAEMYGYKDSELEEEDSKYMKGISVIQMLEAIVKDKEAKEVRFDDGKGRVDMFTASVVTKVFDAVNEENKRKILNMIGTRNGFMKFADFAMKQVGRNESLELHNLDEDMNAILATAGKKKHGKKYMDAAREKSQELGRALKPEEKDKLRDKHSDNRKDEDISEITKLAGL